MGCQPKCGCIWEHLLIANLGSWEHFPFASLGRHGGAKLPYARGSELCIHPTLPLPPGKLGKGKLGFSRGPLCLDIPGWIRDLGRGGLGCGWRMGARPAFWGVRQAQWELRGHRPRGQLPGSRVRSRFFWCWGSSLQTSDGSLKTPRGWELLEALAPLPIPQARVCRRGRHVQ